MVGTEVARLRPTTEADLAFVLAVESDPEHLDWIGQWSRDRHQSALKDNNLRHWIVVEAETARPVGYVILANLLDVDQSLLVQRLVITEKGKGYGRSALRQVIYHAFETFQAHRVWLDVVDTNHRARRLYDSLGFVEEGYLREAKKNSQGYASLVIMALLDQDYRRHPAFFPQDVPSVS